MQYWSIFVVCLLVLVQQSTAEIKRPRGVSLLKAGFYLDDKDFACLDGSGTISIKWVNDDYCDCKDGSDEPGTSACPNGNYHCSNKGYKPKDILSSRVNDGICDCCDGSDEFLGLVPCNDYCKELGLIMKRESDERRQKLLDGHRVYLEYVQKGTEGKQAQTARLEELEKQKDELLTQKEQLEAIRAEAEEPEREAIERQKAIFEEAKKAAEEERNSHRVSDAFDDLDANDDGMVSVDEIQQHEEFDIDSNGEVTAEEAKEYLEEGESVDQATFEARTWPAVKEIYRPSVVDEPAADIGTVEGSYDDETKALVEAANKARADFDEVDRRLKDLDKEISNVKKVVLLDAGPSNEFFPLRDQCFEYTEREYTYKLCPFDSANQRSKNGGGETRLGNWGNWVDKSHRVMNMDRGLSCWNGPARSVKVYLVCGENNVLTSANEPNRCEYEMYFTTPAACSDVPPPVEADYHDEL